MWNGKNKAITFSFDDGVTQDKRAIEILDKYGLKATFNLNSAYLGLVDELDVNGHVVSHNHILPNDVRSVYKNHEIAVHTLAHPNLTRLDENTIQFQVETDRKILSELCGYDVVGMAYPCGGTNNNDRVADIIKNKTGVKYSRTITSTSNFELQNNLYRFNPTVYYIDKKLFNIANSFLKLDDTLPKLMYIWGHTYEMDAGLITWEKFEEFCKFISNQNDVFYGTNREVLL